MSTSEDFRPWLVQRLEKNGRSPREGDNTPTHFMAQIAEFDYMGSSEFEYGSLPKAVNRMVERAADLVASTRPVVVSKPKIWGIEVDAVGSLWEEAPAALTATIYVIAYRESLEEVFAWIQAVDAQKECSHLKESTHFQHSAYFQNWRGGEYCSRKDLKWRTNFTGWFDIREDFMYFTSREQWLGICNILGVTPA